MSLAELVEHLRDESPYDQPPTPTSQEETSPLSEEIFEGESIGEEEELVEEETPRETLMKVKKSLRKVRRNLSRRRTLVRVRRS